MSRWKRCANDDSCVCYHELLTFLYVLAKSCLYNHWRSTHRNTGKWMQANKQCRSQTILARWHLCTCNWQPSICRTLVPVARNSIAWANYDRIKLTADAKYSDDNTCLGTVSDYRLFRPHNPFWITKDPSVYVMEASPDVRVIYQGIFALPWRHVQRASYARKITRQEIR